MDQPVRPKPVKARIRVNPKFHYLVDGKREPAWDVLWGGEKLFIAHSFNRAYKIAADITGEVAAA